MMTKTRILIAFAITAMLSGCASTDGKFNHIRTDDGKCLTCINNPISGKPLNHNGPGVEPFFSEEHNKEITAEQERVKAVAASQPTKYDIHKRVFTVPSGVDMAYVRVKQEFNFYDLDMVKAEQGRDAIHVIQSPRFKYEAVPGVFYKMRSVRKHNGTWLTIDTEILKKTDTSSEIVLRYWLPEGTSDYNKTLYGDGLKERIIKAIEANG